MIELLSMIPNDIKIKILSFLRPYRILLIGTAASGKTTLINKIIYNKEPEQHWKPTFDYTIYNLNQNLYYYIPLKIADIPSSNNKILNLYRGMSIYNKGDLIMYFVRNDAIIDFINLNIIMKDYNELLNKKFIIVINNIDIEIKETKKFKINKFMNKLKEKYKNNIFIIDVKNNNRDELLSFLLKIFFM